MMVAPDREVPGIIARHWAQPIFRASFQVMSSTCSARITCFRRSAQTHDHPAHHQRQGDGDRIEQPLVDQVGEQDAEDYRREERDQQVGGETLGLALARQVTGST